MEISTNQPAQAVVLPATHTSAFPSESFADPNRGNVTWHKLFSQTSTQTSDLSAGVAICPRHTGYFRQHRHTQAEIYYILEGRGTVVIDGIEYPVEKGCALFIPGNSEHGVVNNTEDDLKWLYVFPTESLTKVHYKFSHEMGEGAS
jgi:mannose-6-phosphate isomerase-like protein (cupin superfamily)